MPVEKLLPDRRRGISFGPAVRSLLPGIGKIRYAGNTESPLLPHRHQRSTLILHHLPTRATLLRLDDLVTAMQIIRDRKGPLLFHCWHGSDRTGAVAAMYRMVFQHVPKQHAIDEMVEGIFGFHMIFDNIIDTIDEADIEHIRQELF
jgi:rhodanese-related sulfurtransferase